MGTALYRDNVEMKYRIISSLISFLFEWSPAYVIEAPHGWLSGERVRLVTWWL